jgi:succinate dehydrogenase/fumarate reductase flavoprotein subunit
VKIQVVVVAAGACGLTAALAARDAGAEVLVLERDASPSGSTALSSGFVPAAPTRFQRGNDSAELMASDIQRKNHGEADRRIVDAVCRASGPTIEWLADKHAIPFQLVEGFLYPGHSVERMHCVPEKTGAALMACLLNACWDVDILTSARVSHIDNKSVKFERPDGSTEDVEYGSLVLACSGFGGNPAMVRRHLPEIADALYFGHTGNQGDALRWGEQLGASSASMTAYQGHGSVATPHGILITWALMIEGGIQVNETGERFANEHAGYSEACLPVLRQPGGVAWCVYDERLHQLGLTFPDYQEAFRAGAVKRDPSFPRLNQTLEKTRGLAASGGQDEFGRSFSGRPALAPPYYAIKVTGALFHTQGGLVVDERARVLDRAGRPLPNLFAGGGAACGLSGNHVWGYLSGNGLLSAVVLGRIAGAGAAA